MLDPVHAVALLVMLMWLVLLGGIILVSVQLFVRRPRSTALLVTGVAMIAIPVVLQLFSLFSTTKQPDTKQPVTVTKKSV